MTHNLLIIDSDQALTKRLSMSLSQEGYHITCAYDGKNGLEIGLGQPFDLIILDMILPEMNGLDVLKQIREYQTTPVLVLSARCDDIDRIMALDQGANDYLVKPCNLLELIARLRVILKNRENIKETRTMITFHGITVDRAERSAHLVGDKELALTNTEFNILDMLIQSPGQAFSKEELTESALGRKYTAYDRSIDVHISNLRSKLGNEVHIKTVRGFGYLLSL
ncbi:MAG: response regulator transcription factor [Legionellaceae bacterium]|nr:response regulator transcription factor [Legionellaceae bacterium]